MEQKIVEIYQPTDIEKKALALMQREINAWSNANVQVSNDASFSMRDEIDKCRKNYYGIFETPKDSDSNLEKIWVPLTEWTVETIVKNVDLDTKDITIISPAGKSPQVAQLVRLIVLHFLKLMNFGEFLNDLIRRVAIDGTVPVKTYLKYSNEHKRNLPHLRLKDVLNIVIDPTADSLHEVPLIERAELIKDEIDRYKWDNKEYIKYSKGSIPKVNVYERHGLMPLNFVTKIESDEDKWVEGIIIASSGEKESLFTQASPTTQAQVDKLLVVHKIILDPNKFKQYEECWYKKVPGRWHGRSPGEQLKGLQDWINAVVNIRREELLNKLVGKFKFRKGIGLTRQMFESIKTGGAIPVDQMDDVQELVERDVQGSAYVEPREIINMADRVTGAPEMARGETLPPSLPATTAVLQERSSRSGFVLTQENIGLFLIRLFKRHIIPLVVKALKEGEILRITGEIEDLEILDQMYLNDRFNKKILNAIVATAKVPADTEVAIWKDMLRNDLKRLGKDRDIKILKTIFDEDYDVDIEITGEKFDKGVTVRNLIDAAQLRGLGPEADQLIAEALEIMGISSSRFRPTQAQQVEGRVPAIKTSRETATPRTEFQRANIEGTSSPRREV